MTVIRYSHLVIASTLPVIEGVDLEHAILLRWNRRLVREASDDHSSLARAVPVSLGDAAVVPVADVDGDHLVGLALYAAEEK